MYYYTDHARKRMRERSVTKAEIEYCLNNYEFSYTDKKGNPNYIIKTASGRRIKVVVAKDNSKRIITVAD
ncbi:unnamed protein product [marine sediment metagenome]|uniref:DUF4258 domain-containing protein n=1 Tax=marine sediment metagenome TaxID=412755 RepID=X1RYY4_9ZZZZ